MKHARLHALVLGSALAISSAIVLLSGSQAPRSPRARPAAPPGAGLRDAGKAPAARPGPRSPGAQAAPRGAGRAPPARPRPQGPQPGLSKEEDALVQAEKYIREADELFKSSAAREGREGDLEQAKRYLNRAAELLETLPADDPKAKELRIQRGQLYQDVVRVSGL